MAAFIPEIFGTRYRYSGAGLSLNLAGLVGGAVPTIVAAPLQATWGVPAIGVMMAAVVLVSLVCTAAAARDERRRAATPLSTMRETRRLSNARVVTHNSDTVSADP